eukprot:3970197-Alexandrium_andersonii.AAC.1
MSQKEQLRAGAGGSHSYRGSPGGLPPPRTRAPRLAPRALSSSGGLRPPGEAPSSGGSPATF